MPTMLHVSHASINSINVAYSRRQIESIIAI